nr:carbon starvation protein A [Desulfovibrio sp.]
ATQSPLMARCMKSERQGHFVFYGAMVCEGIIALIWASAACAIYTVADGHMVGLAEKLGSVKPAGVVYEVCKSTMGGIGTVLAMLGVVACPITSGDTAFRSARLTVADWFKIPQAQIVKRLSIAVPLLLVGAGLSQIDFNIVWRYFSWTNQTLAMIVLWTASMYLFLEKKNYWITAVPATFMSAVSATYFCMAPECLGKVLPMPLSVSYGIGIGVAVLFLALFLMATKKRALA